MSQKKKLELTISFSYIIIKQIMTHLDKMFYYLSVLYLTSKILRDFYEFFYLVLKTQNKYNFILQHRHSTTDDTFL